MILADFLGTTWFMALVFLGGGACALAFRPIIKRFMDR